MPIYEYVCEEPGREPVVVELLRSSADADKPVPDPEGKGRVFKRRLSAFTAGSSAPAPGAAGMCACGKRQGGCGGGAG